MIYIFTALYCEAHIFIKHFHLKKIMKSTHFQQFTNESSQILLTITGTGEIDAACAVSSVCTEHSPAQQDFLLNIGICACAEKQNEIFFIHKLVEQTSGKTFYPDILYCHNFREATLITGMVPQKNCEKGSGLLLHDMEAAAIYQAGAYFFAPHQMVFIKIISDAGEDSRLSGEFVKQIMETHKEKLCAYIHQLLQINQAKHTGQTVLDKHFSQLCADLHCSKAMRDALYKYLHYAALAGIDYLAVIQKMYQENKLPCKDKREGKQRFEEFKQQLL